jgi:hypothetical protein
MAFLDGQCSRLREPAVPAARCFWRRAVSTVYISNMHAALARMMAEFGLYGLMMRALQLTLGAIASMQATCLKPV